MNFNDISRLTQYIKIIFQLVISVKLIHGTFYFFFCTKSLKYGVYSALHGKYQFGLLHCH